MQKLVQAFNAHGFYADLHSTYLVRIARDKLPGSLKMKWSEHLVNNGSPFPGLEDLSIWMDKQARDCEHLQDNSFSNNDKNNGTTAIEVNLTKNRISATRKEMATENLANTAITRTATTITQTKTNITQTNKITTTLWS